METQWCPLQSTHYIMYVVILYENLYSFLCPQENKKLALPKKLCSGARPVSKTGNFSAQKSC